MATVDLASVLADLDFEPTLPCEHRFHIAPGDVAQWVEVGTCPTCNVRVKLLTCTLCKSYAQSARTIHHVTGCGESTTREMWGMTWTPIHDVL